MEDMYGNPVLPDTPTTRLLEGRRKQKQESNGRFKLSTRTWQPMTADKAAEYLEKAAAEIREHKVAVIFRFTATEATK